MTDRSRDRWYLSTRALLAAGAVLGIAFVLAVLYRHRIPSARVGKSVIRLQSITSAPPGGLHAYFVAPLWRRRFDDWWLRHIGSSPFPAASSMSAGFTSDDPIAAAFWLIRTEGSQSIPVNIRGIEIEDEHGCVFKSLYTADQILQLAGSKQHLGIASFSVLPRRERTFKAKLFCNDSAEPIFLTIQNPFPPTFPEPPPESIPIIRKQIGAEFVLTSFTISPEDKDQRFRAGLEIRTNGMSPAPGWGQPTVEFEDLTGNRLKSPACRGEKTYKVIANFYRSAEASFSPAEVWKLRVGVPPRGQCVTTNLSKDLPNGTISICAAMNDGAFEYVSERCTPSGPVPAERSWLYKCDQGGVQIQTHKVALLVRPGIPIDRRLLVRARDQQGNVEPARAMRGVRDYIIELNNPRDNVELELELMIEEPHRVEYVARPARTVPAGKEYKWEDPFSWTIY
jgi:hypothetical protein